MSDWTTNWKWGGFTGRQKRTIVAVGAAHLVFLAAALIDLRRRPAHAIRGSKRLWTPIVFLDFIGPAAYFLIGRKR